ncbi:reverse transcriptase [Phytophthora megakarya]|uniref:Reverse transcriptase n=1 Tax=Phytophthora megakarya TaxID=4795 RepID=A0A225W684_9STRA|nr:reverse transcriptase [Phytophthora megakarya]
MLIKELLSATIIAPSISPWASPIVVIIKANGVDIRLCIDYQVVNRMTRLTVYPMPLINDLLEDLDKVLWYCSLDMASGFWVVSMTPRARLISAFITPFGLFEWARMPFGLKNAPQIYQRIVDNALYGHMRIKPGQDKTVDVFEEGEPEPEPKPSVLGRRSYVDDILVSGDTWDSMCNKVKNLLDVCERWNLSISVAKSHWGRRKVTYLGHQVSTDGWEAKPKDLEAFSNLPFPTKLKSMQSFLGSLNYYSRFIEDFAVYAAILYELRESTEEPEEGTALADEERDRWTRAMNVFTKLKAKIISTPILKHFDPGRAPVIVLYANKWAISAALMQKHGGVYWPVTFTSRTLKANELNYGIVDKEVLAFLRTLDVCYSQLVTRSIKVLSRFSTLAWLLKSSGLDGRLGRWAALLSGWTLEITKCSKGEEEILGAIAASITPPAEVDEALMAIAPKKQPRKMIAMTPPNVEPEESLLVASFDGSARVKHAGGAYSAILWKLPEWTILEAKSEHQPDLTVNEAEYRELLLCFNLLSTQARGRVVFCGDSNLVIRQMRGEIDCKAPGLQLLRQKTLNQLRSWPKYDFVHVKREWNQSVDKLASAALQREEGEIVTAEEERQDLITLNRLHEILQPRSARSVTHVNAITRCVRRTPPPAAMDESIVRRIRSQRIKQAQDEEKWIVDLKAYLNGDLNGLSKEEAKACSKIAATYEVDKDGLLFYCPRTLTRDEDRDDVVRLVMPESLQQDFLHHYHTSLEGGHQGVGRTYRRIRTHFHWRNLYRSVQRYVGECTDCETGKGKPTDQGRSPGNVQDTYPFQVISMDHIPSLPKSFKGNTELLIWADLFTGYVIAKRSPRLDHRGEPKWWRKTTRNVSSGGSVQVK